MSVTGSGSGSSVVLGKRIIISFVTSVGLIWDTSLRAFSSVPPTLTACLASFFSMSFSQSGGERRWGSEGLGGWGSGEGGGEEGFSIMISRNRLRIPTATFEFAFLCVIVHSTRAIKKPGGQFYFGANGVMLLISLFTPA